MKILISILLLISSFISLTSQEKKKCDANGLRHADSNMARILTLGSSGRKFPENKEDELRKYCNETNFHLKEVQEYKTRCLKGLAKQLVSVVSYTIGNQINQLCKRDSKRLDDLIKSMPCGNLANAELHKCYAKFNDALLGAQNDKNDNKKIPYTCCNYYAMYPCFDKALRRFPLCSAFNSQALQAFFHSLFADAIELLCPEYNNESDKCDKLNAPPKKRKNQRRAKSWVIPLIGLFQSFKEL